jgi:hypothetical protein
MQLLPIIVEAIMREVMGKLIVVALICAMIHTILCSGEMCTIPWIPLMFKCAIFSAMLTVVDETEPYTPKWERFVERSWFMENIPSHCLTR